MKHQNRITVLTCTYNRADLLDNLYRSLQKQTDYGFDWLVVDDGSTDNTKEKIEFYKKVETKFVIRYVRQENGGKHRAINRGMKEKTGEYIFLVDSDDELTPDAIETVNQWLKTIDGKDGYAGVAGLRSTKTGKILGSYPKNKKYKAYVDATNIERFKFNLTGDKAEIYKAKLLREYSFPEYEGEIFISEDVVWNRIAMDGYKIRWFPIVIYLCDYLDGGLTKNNNKWIENFEGFTYQTSLAVHAFKGVHRIRPIVKYIYWSKVKKLKPIDIIDNISISYVSYIIGTIGSYVYSAVNKMHY